MTNQKKTLIFIMIACLWLTSSGENPPGLFDSEEPLDLVLEYDVNKFKKDRGLKRDYHPAKLSYITLEGKQVTLDAEIRVRGKLRRQLLKCIVPPVRFKFDKTKTKGTLFENQGKLKLVSHCKNKPKYYEHYYMIEYLIYKTYNILTDLSFRVRQVRITYTDTKNITGPFTKYGFFIEYYKDMAKRNNAKPVDIESIPLEQADFETSTLASVFQYMIGNTDWSIRSSHNMKLVKYPGNPNYFPVPFDFDMAGLIDAHYARPDLALPLRSVRERLFRGFCKNLGQFNRTFMVYHKHKEEIFALYRDNPILPDKLKIRCVKYLKAFYQIISSPKLVKRYFIDNYRGRPRPKK